MINHKVLLYALEVSREGSVVKAAEKLYVSQPNLSKMIIALEEEIGVQLFNRTPKGMVPTNDGEVLFRYAEDIKRQTDLIESYCKKVTSNSFRMSAAVIWADYISEAFTNFLDRYSVEKNIEFSYIETDTESIINKVVYSECHMGIIRCDKRYENNFRRFFEVHSLAAEILCEARCVAVFAEDSFLSERKVITNEDLDNFFEVRQSKNFVPEISESQLRSNSDALPGRIIYVSDGIAQAELVSRNSGTYMIIPPLSPETLKKYKLVQRDIDGMSRESIDYFIRSENYSLSKTDNAFLDELMISKRKYKQEVLL
ncbi:MAG: LysR family transcriptional regulator [Ruminococcus sp.]|uniref:LysR family transcriptional regulator n=1 Tax=Ruminococcus sp. TaxID=41978 RepID=UPI001569C738|nr:LysR family transcriptional regulator [Ruminococcus sp.]MCR5601253.1 LysR family transcriptional regulator [Ruminococcus sp.]